MLCFRLGLRKVSAMTPFALSLSSFRSLKLSRIETRFLYLHIAIRPFLYRPTSSIGGRIVVKRFLSLKTYFRFLLFLYVVVHRLFVKGLTEFRRKKKSRLKKTFCGTVAECDIAIDSVMHATRSPSNPNVHRDHFSFHVTFFQGDDASR